MSKRKKRQHSRLLKNVTNDTRSPSTVVSPEPTRLLIFFEKWGLLFASGIALLALGLRIWHIFEIRENDPYYTMPSVDPKVYHEWGIKLASGESDNSVFFLSPLYPYFLGAIYWLFGPGFTVARIFQAVISSLNCLVVFALGKRVFDSRVGAIASLALALYPPAIFYETLFLAGVLQSHLVLLTILALHCASENPSKRLFGLSGFLLGLAALARPNALLIGVFVLGWIALQARKQQGASIKQSCILAAVFCIGVGLSIAPATGHNYSTGKDIVLISSQGGVNFFIGNGPDANGYFQVPHFFDEATAGNPLGQQLAFKTAAEEDLKKDLMPSEVSSYWYGRTSDHIVENTGKWFGLLIRKFGLFLNHYEIYNSRDLTSGRDYSIIASLPLLTFGIITPLALLGIAISILQRRRAFFLYGVLISFAISLCLFFVLARYRIPVVPYLALFAAFGLVQSGQWILKWRKNTRSLGCASLFLVLAFGIVHMEIAENEQNRWAIFYNLGNNYLETRKYRSAIAQYKKARELAPGIISIHHNLALVYEKDPATLRDAKKSWEAVLKIASKRNDQMYIERATAHIQLMDHYLGK